MYSEKKRLYKKYFALRRFPSNYSHQVSHLLKVKNMAKRLFAITFTFLFIIGQMFMRKKRMKKSPVWRGFLSEAMWIDDYKNLSLFKKVIFWVNYPLSYTKYLWVVIWDRLDRLYFRDSRTKYNKTKMEQQKPINYSNMKSY